MTGSSKYLYQNPLGFEIAAYHSADQYGPIKRHLICGLIAGWRQTHRTSGRQSAGQEVTTVKQLYTGSR